MEKTLKIISLISYSLIILAGQMIGLPLLLWLVWTSFEFGNSDQIFAIFGLIGLLLIFTKYYKRRIIKILSLLVRKKHMEKKYFLHLFCCVLSRCCSLIVILFTSHSVGLYFFYIQYPSSSSD